MSVFGNYARYYDLLYKDKDYIGEVTYVDGLLKKYGKTPKSILELGCGTGKHALMLASKGYTVTGVDQSEDMLKAAANRRQKEYASSNVEFVRGDARTVKVGKTFDAVISLFHVMSYQTTNEDLLNAFKTAATHLNPGGVFVFDCWYGPAVLTDRPEVRVKRLEDDTIQVTRIAEPEMHPNENLVDVTYSVFIKDKKDGSVEEIKEKHIMRYLFKPELEEFLAASGFNVLRSEEWMTERSAGFNTWGVTVVCKLIRKVLN